jgi:4'-phosphopantetheinyl transferase
MDVDCQWPLPPSDLSLSGDEVHVWCASLNQFYTCVEQMTQILSVDELKRAERFHFPRHRNQYIAAHGLLRKLLADYTSIESDRITIEYGRNGKPFLSEKFSKEKIRFNLSHSNGCALFAFACEREIGVDIEHIREFADMDKVAEQVFSIKEIAVLRSFPESEKNEVFFKFWTRKEAYLKATGEGFSSALDTIDISSYPPNTSVFVYTGKNSKDKSHWTVQDLRPISGFAAAFAVEGDSAMHHCWRIPNSFIQSFDKNC